MSDLENRKNRSLLSSPTAMAQPHKRIRGIATSMSNYDDEGAADVQYLDCHSTKMARVNANRKVFVPNQVFYSEEYFKDKRYGEGYDFQPLSDFWE